MKVKNNKEGVALSSVFASGFLTISKLIVGLLTGSIGIISEAAHSALDLGAAMLTYFAVRIGDKPADKEHPYGHLKVESVSALIETGLLFLTSIWIIYEAVRRLLFGTSEVKVTWYAIAIIIVSIVVDISRSRALNKVAKETNSQALEADALHFSSDILSSLVVLVGLIFVAIGFNKADAIAAIGVSFFVFYAGYKLGKRTIDVLVDAAPEGITDKVIELTRKVKGVISIERIRVRPVGPIAFVDMIVNVSRKLPLEKIQIIHNKLDEEIHKVFKEADTTIQVKPLSLKDETIIERIQIVAANHNLSVHDIVVHTEHDKKYASFDLEVDADLTIEKAHDKATHLEQAIKQEIGDDVEINTHIEPLRQEIMIGKSLPIIEEEKIKKIITDIATQSKQIYNVHKIKIRRTEGKFFVTMHCLIPKMTQFQKTHDLASRLEYLIKDSLPNVERVVVHMEPNN